MDGRWVGGGWEVDGRWTGGGWGLDGRWVGGEWEVDAASAVSVITSTDSGHRCKTRRAKAKTFRHEGFPGDSSA